MVERSEWITALVNRLHLLVLDGQIRLQREGARLHWRAASDVSCDKEGREPLVETSSEAANR